MKYTDKECTSCNGARVVSLHSNQPKDVIGCCMVNCSMCHGTGKMPDYSEYIKSLKPLPEFPDGAF